jgi:hypothetical protein
MTPMIALGASIKVERSHYANTSYLLGLRLFNIEGRSAIQTRPEWLVGLQQVYVGSDR